MKKKLWSVLLTLVLVLSLVTPVFAVADTSDLDKEISTLEPEVDKFQKELDALSKDVNSLTGTIISTKPFIIQGSGVGEQCTAALLSGIKYFVINNPEDGDSSTGLLYKGVHKYVGTTTITIGRQNYTAYVFDEFNDTEKLLAVGNKLKEKKAGLDDLKLQKEARSHELSFFVWDRTADELIMQIGNPNMRIPSGNIVPIDPLSNNACPVTVNGSTMVPIRAVVEPFGGTVTWDNPSKKATLSLGKNVIELKGDSTIAIVNGRNLEMTVPAQIINSKMMVPVRFASENLGMKVEWLNLARVIRITYDSSEAFLNNPDDYLTINNDNTYTFNDRVMLCKFTYPKSWGKPQVNPAVPYQYKKYNLSFISDNKELSLTITYNGTPEEHERKTVSDKTTWWGYKKFPLSSNNSNIEIIAISDNDGANSWGGGGADILCTNGSIISIGWSTPSDVYEGGVKIESGLSEEKKKEIDSQVMEMIKSFVIDAPMG